jgi:hypothetical protein
VPNQFCQFDMSAFEGEWSEKYWLSNGPQTLSDVLDAAKGLAQLRAELLGAGPSVQFVRVGDDSGTRVSLDANVIYKSSRAATDRACFAQQGLEYLMESSNQPYYYETRLFRAVPDSIITGNNTITRDADYLKAEENFIQALQGNDFAWGMKVTNRAAGFGRRAITSIVTAAGGQCKVTCDLTNINVGDQIRIAGAKCSDGSPINQKWTVRPDPTTGLIGAGFFFIDKQLLNGATVTVPGLCSPTLQIVVPYTSIQCLQIGTRRLTQVPYGAKRAHKGKKKK